MSLICPCGRPATHRVRWNPWLEVSEPVPSRSPARCLECSAREARANTERKRAALEREREFHGSERHVFWSETQVPHQWYVLVHQAARRHPEIVNPGGLVEVHRNDGHVQVELCPPKERPATWEPTNCLYLLRYLTKLPLVFVRRPTDESLSPRMWRESRKQWSDTLNLPVLREPSEPEPSSGDLPPSATS